MDTAENTRLHAIEVNDAELEMIRLHRAKLAIEQQRKEVRGVIFSWLPRWVRHECDEDICMGFNDFVNLFDEEMDQLQGVPPHAAYAIMKEIVATVRDEISKCIR